MKTIIIFAFVLGVVIASGCTSDDKNFVSGSSQTPTETFLATSDPSLPASSAEKYCLDITKMDVVKHRQPDAYGGVEQYNPMVTITGTIKSNCNYPVEGVIQLFAYDKNNKMITGLFQNGVQDAQPVLIKPGETKSYSTTFDMRRVPDNPRDPDPSISANFKVTAFVKRIVSAREAAAW